MKKVKKLNALDLVQEQYRRLKVKFKATHDVKEKQVLFRRLINLLGVMHFLMSINYNS